MALRLDKCIVRGWIDNRTKGTVTGELWLYGREHPVTLQLNGNCWRDIAGCRVAFVNPDPGEESNMNGLFQDQWGSVGDMTASRKVRCDVPETYRGKPLNVAGVPRVERKPGEPTPMATCLYLEWFSQRNGRVVVETCMFDVEVEGEPSWTMSTEEEQMQSQANADALKGFIEEAQEAFEQNTWEKEVQDSPDEFEWEQILRESDDRTEKLGKLMEAYQDHPDRDRIIAREMGWDRLEDLLDAEDRGLFEEEKRKNDESAEEMAPEPDPLTKGRDWVYNERGEAIHPLQLRVFNFAIQLHHRYRDRGMLGENVDDDLHNMIFQVQTLGAKLAGALNGLAYDRNPEPGLVVASLKRGLQYVNDGVAAADKVAEKNLLDDAELDEYRRELLAVREEMHALMQRFREQT